MSNNSGTISNTIIVIDCPASPVSSTLESASDSLPSAASSSSSSPSAAAAHSIPSPTASSSSSSSSTSVSFSTASSSTVPDSASIKRCRRDWLASPELFAQIDAAVQRHRSYQRAVTALQQNEVLAGVFDTLTESTVRSWYVQRSFEVKKTVQRRLSGQKVVRSGRPSVMSQHPEVEAYIVDAIALAERSTALSSVLSSVASSKPSTQSCSRRIVSAETGACGGLRARLRGRGNELLPVDKRCR